MSETEKGAVLLDDGEYYVQHNSNYPADRGNGFLQRRCHYSLTTPGGWECIGGYDQKPNGSWTADIAAPYDEETDSDVRVLGEFENRLDAIHALWNHRHEAVTRHPRY